MTQTQELTCVICGVEFLTNTQLDQHLEQAHSQAQDEMTCSFCGTHLGSRLLLERHLEEAHRDPLTDRIPCPECGVVLAGPAEVEEHLAQEHPTFPGMTRDTGPSKDH